MTSWKWWKTTTFWPLFGSQWYHNILSLNFSVQYQKLLFWQSFVDMGWEKKNTYKSCYKPGFLPAIVGVLWSRTSTWRKDYPVDFIPFLIQNADHASYGPSFPETGGGWLDILSPTSDSIHTLQQRLERYTVTLFVWPSEDDLYIHFMVFFQQPS